MKEGDILIFTNTEPISDFGNSFTINEKYIVKEFGEMYKGTDKYISWVIVEDNNGSNWELDTLCFTTLSDFRNQIINNIIS